MRRSEIAAASLAVFVAVSPMSQAHIATDQLPQYQPQLSQQPQRMGVTAGFDPEAVGQIQGGNVNIMHSLIGNNNNGVLHVA